METTNTNPTPQPSVGMRRHLGQRAYTVSYGTAGEDGTTLTVDTRTGLKSTAPAEGADTPAVRIVFYPWNWDYDSIVSAVINAEIPPDRMTAIQNNYMLDPTDPEAKAEFDWMQSVRARAKSLARQALQSTEEGLSNHD